MWGICQYNEQAAGWTVKQLLFDSWQGEGIFLSSKTSGLAVGLT
jgi:hypothetical protein